MGVLSRSERKGLILIFASPTLYLSLRGFRRNQLRIGVNLSWPSSSLERNCLFFRVYNTHRTPPPSFLDEKISVPGLVLSLGAVRRGGRDGPYNNWARSPAVRLTIVPCPLWFDPRTWLASVSILLRLNYLVILLFGSLVGLIYLIINARRM